MADTKIAEYKPSFLGSLLGSFSSWTQSSATMLRSVEKKILSYLKTTYRGWYVDIGPVVGSSDKIWTISLNEDSPYTPLVLVHGLGSGVALWCMNLDAFAVSRPVYALDVLGFGRSSRPSFSSDPIESEQQLVKSIEEWRREMKLDKIILLGHSFGGFIVASYAINYPESVKHLILAEPWGFPERPAESKNKSKVPLWIRFIAYAVRPLNPLWAVRFVGPFGQMLIDKMRPDLRKKFAPAIPGNENLISQYIYHCNSQTPSGESAFHSMMNGFGWAKNPIVNRIHQLREDIPITLLYGARSWVDNSTGDIKTKRTNSYVNVQVISGAGHHVYADKPDIFNKHVIDACGLADGKRDHETLIQSENTNTDKEPEKNYKIHSDQNTSSVSAESS